MTRDRAGVILAEAGLPPEPPVSRDLPDFDLGALAAEGIAPPEMVAGGMLYPGAVHCLAGQPGGGKTTVAAWWLLTHIRAGGHVMLLDEESGPELAAEKFLDLGASPAELRPPHFSYVPFPARGWNLADVAQLHDRIAERGPGIVAWDSAAAFLSMAGRDENSAAEVTGFWQRVLVPCARQHGAAVVVVDHTGKGEHGGFGRGSSAKKASSDVQFILETIRPFNRGQDGLLSLTTSPGKDRRGRLAVRYEIRVTAGAVLRLDMAEASRPAPGTPRGEAMPPAKAKLLEALNAIGTEPVTAAQIVDCVAAKHGHGLRRPTVSTYLNELAAEGLADCIDKGTGRARLWLAVARADPDARAPGWPEGTYGEEANR